MKPFADLHLHSNMSDGTMTPSEIVRKAAEIGLKAISITDHDTVDGVKKALKAAETMAKKGSSVEVIPGIEISCYEPEKGFSEVHVLGYFIDPDSSSLKKLLLKASQERIKQKKKIIKKLNEIGFELGFDELMEFAKGEVGRPHIAAVLCKKYPEHFSSVNDVFIRYISNSGPAYVEREHLTRIDEAVKAIMDAGGLPVLAHPLVYGRERSRIIINYFIECRGRGVETMYPYSRLYPHKGFDHEKQEQEIRLLKGFVKNKGLFETGGSDFHGKNRNVAMNEMKVPYELVKKMKKYLN